MTRRGRLHSWTAARELYDEQTDPDENGNLADAPANAELIQALGQQLWKSLTRPAGEHP